jgi:hypothetical protein
MYGNDRLGIRQVFLPCHRKMREGTPLDAMEQLIAEVIQSHPEYHPLLDAGDRSLDQDFQADAPNPFLHMGLHISLLEQLKSDRPHGIRDSYLKLLQTQGGDDHATQHQAMACLEALLWNAQQGGQPPDERHLLDCIQQQVKGR